MTNGLTGKKRAVTLSSDVLTWDEGERVEINQRLKRL